jgi:ankyrin repeat protein
MLTSEVSSGRAARLVKLSLKALPDSIGLKEIKMLLKQKLVLLFAIIAMFGCAGPAANTQDEGKSPARPSQAADEMRDVDGRTILMRTVETGDIEGAQRLIDAGADVNARSNSGVTALMTAAGMGHLDVTRLLLEKGADVNAKTPGNYTALMNAALTGQGEIVKVLLDAGADPNVKDVSGKTARDYALSKEHKDIADLLEQRASEASK